METQAWLDINRSGLLNDLATSEIGITDPK